MDIIGGFTVAVFKGFVDSLRGVTVLFYLDKEINERVSSHHSPSKESSTSGKSKVDPHRRQKESKVLRRIWQSWALNGGIFWLSIFVFEILLLPLVRYLLTLVFGHNSGSVQRIWSWMQPLLLVTFRMIWVLPLFFLSKVVNSLWFQDIADSAFLYSRGRRRFFSGVSKIIADSMFSLLVQALFLIQSMLVSLVPIPYIGDILCLVHMCLLYSLYSFEYKWFNMGWELHKRLTFIENNWAYFLGFGLPLAVLTQIPNSYIVSGCVFSLLFPFFIISGNEANPVTGSDYPLRLFSPVIAISNALFRLIKRNAENKEIKR